MNEEFSPSQPSRSTSLLRWLAILLVAFLTSWLASSLTTAIFSSLGLLAGGAAALTSFLQLIPSGFAFTAAGAYVVLSHRLKTAIFLAVLCFLMALVVHILSQPDPGLTNWMHLAGTTSGAVLGVLFIKQKSRVSASSEL